MKAAWSVASFAGAAIFAALLREGSALARDLPFLGLDELRLGGASSVDWSGNNGYVHFEALFSPLPPAAAYDPKWSWLLSPRPLIGMTVNPQGKTNEFFAGFGWTVPAPGGFFLDFSLGGLVHNQKLSDTYADQPGLLTTRFLFRESIGVGYEINPKLRIIAFADHGSNGNLGDRNHSVNHVGLLLGGKLANPEKPISVTAPISSFSWAGAFAGLNAGIAFGKFNFVILEPGAPGEVTNATGSSLNIGGQLGYNWVLGPLLMGFEGDFSSQHAIFSVTRFHPIQEETSSAVFWLATARVRIGLDIQQEFFLERFLLYGTGGAAFARRVNSHCHPANDRLGLCYYANGDIAGGWISETGNRFGWTAGTGVEFPISTKVSAKLEYLYAKFGNSSFGYGVITNGVDVSEHILRAGGNIKLN